MEAWYDTLATFGATFGATLQNTLSVLASLFESFSKNGSEASTVLTSFRQTILDQFGQNGLYAAYISCGAIALFVLVKILKLTFTILRVVVLPSVALAFVGSFFLPVSFYYLLPVTVSLSSVWLVFRT